MAGGNPARFMLFPLLLLLLLFLEGCASIPYDYPRSISSALYRPETTRMGKKVQARVAKHQGASGFYLLSTGEDAFCARVLLMDRAEKTLDLQYYILQGDLTGNFLLNRIVAAAERGVRVRLLIDDWYDTPKMDWWLAVMDIHPNIEVRVFNPFGGHRESALLRPFQMAFGPKRLRGRMHNKAFIADNSVAIVGGRNLADEYFGASSDFNFSDIDVIALGPIARGVSAVFDDYWHCVLSVPLQALMTRDQPTDEDLQKARRHLETQREALEKSTYGLKVRQSFLLKQVEAGMVPLIWAKAEVLSDEPLKCIDSDNPERSAKMARQVRAFIEEAQSEVLLMSPYFVPRKTGVQWYQKMRDRGVRLKVITNSFASTDAPQASLGYNRYRKDLLRMGVDLYELRPTPAQQRSELTQLGGDLYQFGTSLLQFPASLIQFGSSLAQPGGSSKGALHAKTLVLDRKAVFVGSFNLDPRSASLDTQNGVVIRSPELAEQAAGLFDVCCSPARTFRVSLIEGKGLVWVTEENGQEVRYHKEPLAPFWHRTFQRCLSFITPESLL